MENMLNGTVNFNE